jgi:hypothetical protein
MPAAGDVSTFLENRAALGTHEMRVTGRLASALAVTERAVAVRADPLAATCLVEHPRPKLERRPMANVLRVATRQLDHPVTELVAPKADDRAHHGVTEYRRHVA